MTSDRPARPLPTVKQVTLPSSRRARMYPSASSTPRATISPATCAEPPVRVRAGTGGRGWHLATWRLVNCPTQSAITGVQLAGSSYSHPSGRLHTGTAFIVIAYTTRLLVSRVFLCTVPRRTVDEIGVWVLPPSEKPVQGRFPIRRRQSKPEAVLPAQRAIWECHHSPKCRHDHRLKQHPRWKVNQLPDGTFRWTTPSGRSYDTEPTRYPV